MRVNFVPIGSSPGEGYGALVAGIVERAAGAYVSCAVDTTKRDTTKRDMTKRTSEQGAEQSLIGAILSVLDDRNLEAALRLLESPGDRHAAADQQGEQRCARCVTRGE